MASPEGPTMAAHEARASTRTVGQAGSRLDLWPASTPDLGTDGRVRAASGGDLPRPASALPPRPAVGATAPSEVPHAEVDLAAAAAAVSDLLDALGVDRDSEGCADTPARVARAYAELLTPEPFEATTFANDEGYDELVVARSIPFSSLCEHHLLPFAGIAHVGYLPGERLLGLSKLARVVTHFSRRLQFQERLTTQITNWLVEALHPKGVGVVLEAEHACMSLRGVRSAGSMTLTSALAGLVRDDERTRAEFFSLVGHRP
jgi:GTP cyclohydrolase I